MKCTNKPRISPAKNAGTQAIEGWFLIELFVFGAVIFLSDLRLICWLVGGYWCL